MRDSIENISQLQKKLNDLQLENQILKNILDKAGLSYHKELSKLRQSGSKEAFDPKQGKTSVYKGYKRDKIEMRGDRAEISDFPLYLNTVAGGLDCRDQTIGGFSFVVKIYAVPVVEIIG